MVLERNEFAVQLVPKEGITAATVGNSDLVVVLDTNVTPELEAEGIARDFVRLVQQARKNAGLHVSDRITLWIEADAATQAALRAHLAYIQEQVLATAVEWEPSPIESFAAEGKVGSGAGASVTFWVTKR